MNISPSNGNSQLNIFQLFSHANQLMQRFDILLLNNKFIEIQSAFEEIEKQKNK